MGLCGVQHSSAELDHMEAGGSWCFWLLARFEKSGTDKAKIVPQIVPGHLIVHSTNCISISDYIVIQRTFCLTLCRIKISKKHWNHVRTTRNRSTASRLPAHLSTSIRSASQQALNKLQRQFSAAQQLRKLGLPQKRTSFISNATVGHSPKQIAQIALKKWICSYLFFPTFLYHFDQPSMALNATSSWRPIMSFNIILKGVISSGTLAFALLRKNRAAKRGESRPLLKVIRSEFFKATTLRLATFLASYSALWNLSYPALLKLAQKPDQPLTPLPTNVAPTKTSSADLPATRALMDFLSHWAASIAGGVAGLALLAQTKEERVNLAPNILCRGLYTLAKHRPLINFPYGDLLLFGISNAQIMSAFVMSPKTLPGWYWHWICRVGKLDPQFLRLDGLMNRGTLSDMSLIKQVIDRTKPRSLGNQNRLKAWLSSPQPFTAPFAPCHLNHPNFDNCFQSNLARSGDAFKSIPIRFLYSIAKKSISSALFLSSFVLIILHSLCIPSRIYEWRGWHIRGSPNFAIAGFATSLALLWEDPRRRGELALYCAPKALSSAWGVLKAKGLVKSLTYGEITLASAGTAMLMHCFIHAPEKMPSLIRGIISQLVDPHTPDRTTNKTIPSPTSLPSPVETVLPTSLETIPPSSVQDLSPGDPEDGYLTFELGRKS
ncbi:hypothetical protein CROQUDRAFT_88051 [Cronartium quercuum f. sp. fusiforme G11]|uniref:Transmembrane protein 135 N-terminal domain-containing protein n=1 Tax=Cronartium quercuum f. sp. fusiforme G11 TaxID=708437 RepID=A0A9P6TFT0_9BASI|nr:hypothetical protein CROQUDRAFT_88051 [Cronartium quercuum f. sp. fusiforme G11]